MIVHSLDPVLVDLGVVQIRYYGLFYIIGIIISFFILRKLAKERKLGLSSDDVIDYLVYLAVGLLAGGRVFYFIFYSWQTIFSDPLEVLMLWHGGMSFHGSLIGMVAAGLIFCKRRKLDPLEIGDITVIPVALALALGRIGNLFNAELYGRPWDGWLCIDYTQNPAIGNKPELCRYPSQLAESLKNLLIFSTLWLLRGKSYAKGSLFSLFLIFYGTMRFLVEFIRQPDPQLGFVFGPFTMGQVLSMLMVPAGAMMLWMLNKRGKAKKEKNASGN